MPKECMFKVLGGSEGKPREGKGEMERRERIWDAQEKLIKSIICFQAENLDTKFPAQRECS